MREHMREGSARVAIVIADLLRRGYEVWVEALGDCSCDLIARKSVFLRIEVKGLQSMTRARFPVGPVTKRAACKQDDSFDVLAIVDGVHIQYHRNIKYTPDEDSLELTNDHEQISKSTTHRCIESRATTITKQEAQ